MILKKDQMKGCCHKHQATEPTPSPRKYYKPKQSSFPDLMDTKLTPCQEKHFSLTAWRVLPMYMGGSHLPDVAVYFSSLPLTCACFLWTPPTSPIYHVEKKSNSVNLANELAVPINTTVSTYVLVYASSLIADGEWMIRPPTQGYLDIQQYNIPWYNLALKWHLDGNSPLW